MQEDIKTPLILGRPFLSTTNAQIDVGAREIWFHINRKEERFAFKPRPKQCSMVKMVWREKEAQPTQSASLGLDQAPMED
jgi:hypothetical protein